MCLHEPTLLPRLVERVVRRKLWTSTATFILNRWLHTDVGDFNVRLALHTAADMNAMCPTHIAFLSSVSVYPPKGLTSSDERKLASLGYYKAIAERIKSLGYQGKWRRNETLGRWCTFTKELNTAKDAWKELRMLEGLDPADLLVGRRVRTAPSRQAGSHDSSSRSGRRRLRPRTRASA
jgi:hypothetical protein